MHLHRRLVFHRMEDDVVVSTIAFVICGGLALWNSYQWAHLLLRYRGEDPDNLNRIEQCMALWLIACILLAGK